MIPPIHFPRLEINEAAMLSGFFYKYYHTKYWTILSRKK